MPTYEQGVKVTPRMARTWLDRNADNNRNPKLGRIPGYARDMIYDRWRADTGETIKFDSEGWLIDGQNRLMAVVLAGEDPDYKGWTEFDIVRDVPREAMVVIDSGAARTYGDVLKVKAKERMRASAIVRWVNSWDAGYPMNSGRGAARTHSEMDEMFAQDPDRFSAAALRGTDAYRLGLGPAAPVGTAYVLFHRIEPEACETFFDQVIGGENLPSGHPALLLRNRMGRAKVDRVMRPEVLALYIRAWNFTRPGRSWPKNGRLIIAHDELTNATFPRPMDGRNLRG